MVLGLGTSACGHIPGYYPAEDKAPESASWAPKSPPAPPPVAAARRGADEGDAPEADEPYDDAARDTQDTQDTQDTAGIDESAADEPESDTSAPPYTPPAPRPPRHTPPPAWEPTREPASRPQPPTSPPARPTTPEPASPERADGVRTIRLDADTYYLVDSARNLCFLRHKESMTAVDCARVAGSSGDSSNPAALPKPAARPPEPPPTREPVRPAEPERPARPARAPTSPTPDETVRFEAAFTDIVCDRKSQDDTSPEDRIRGRGLSIDRYEAIESWWAADENAWFTLTGRAAKGCRR